MGAREVIAADELDDVTTFLLELALVDDEPAPSVVCWRPLPDPELLERAAAAHRLLSRGDVADGPLLLSMVVWPPAEVVAQTSPAALR